MKKKVVQFIYFFTFTVYCYASSPETRDSTVYNPPVSGDIILDYQVHPTMDMGTHVNSFGIRGWLSAAVPADYWSFLFTANGALIRCQTTYGIPGASDTAQVHLRFTAGWGGVSPWKAAPMLPSGPGTHNLYYQWSHYFTTDGTEQHSGEFGYEWNTAGFRLYARFDNDYQGLGLTDEYRTAAGEVILYHALGTHAVGYGLGYRLWTGTTGLDPMTRYDTYNMTGAYGAEYSHGILYAAAAFDGLRLEAGYDSEQIRDAIQNNLHWIINNARVPLLDRPSRFFMRFSLNWVCALYQ